MATPAQGPPPVGVARLIRAARPVRVGLVPTARPVRWTLLIWAGRPVRVGQRVWMAGPIRAGQVGRASLWESAALMLPGSRGSGG